MIGELETIIISGNKKLSIEFDFLMLNLFLLSELTEGTLIITSYLSY